MHQSNKSDVEIELRQQIDELPEHNPARELWQGVEHGIVEQTTQANNDSLHISHNKGFFALAASIVFASCLLVYSLNNISRVLPYHDLTQHVVAQIDAQHQAQVQTLLAQFAQTPTTTENWQSQLDELDNAASAIKQALQQDPGNTALLQMLKRVHQQQIELIETVHVPQWQSI